MGLPLAAGADHDSVNWVTLLGPVAERLATVDGAAVNVMRDVLSGFELPAPLTATTEKV
jgi:hypothetical protein